MSIGLLHPGEMGAAIGAALVEAGKQVRWASAGRSQETWERASAAQLVDDNDIATLLSHSDLVISVCPPHAAADVAAEVAAAARGHSDWIYVDANAVAPATANTVAEIVGQAQARDTSTAESSGHLPRRRVAPVSTSRAWPPQRRARHLRRTGWTSASSMTVRTLLLLSSSPTPPGRRGQLRCCWPSAAAAVRAGVDEALLDEWQTSQAGLEDRWEGARRSALSKGWRWSGEMTEIAKMFDELGLPTGFHTAAATVFEEPDNLV